MIIKEFYRKREDGVSLYRTYSDQNFKIRKVGSNDIYDDAIDIENSPYKYEETDIKIDNELNNSDISDAEFRAIIEGVL